MLVSFIQNTDFVYINLHAEEVITSNYLNDDNAGIYIKSLQFQTVDRIFTYLRKLKCDATVLEYLVLDLSELEYCQANLSSKIIAIRELGYMIIFLNVNKFFSDNFGFSHIQNSKNEITIDNTFEKFYFFNYKEPQQIYGKKINPREIFESKFKELIKKNIISYKEPHASSFIYLNSFIDIKSFISHENKFLVYSLYRLALKIKNRWKKELSNQPILVCQSLSSSLIVSILSQLLNLDILIFDKIGPINKLYTKIDKTISADRKYIVVSDLVCLGTEVKIVKNLIEYSGGKYLGNVSLVKIETLKKIDIKRKDATTAVFSVTNENNVELKYGIYTNLISFNG